jgi:hypothetical protein
MGYLDDKVMLNDIRGILGCLFGLVWEILKLPFKILGIIPWDFQKRRAQDLMVCVGEPRHMLRRYGIEGEEKPLRALVLEGIVKDNDYRDLLNNDAEFERANGRSPNPNPMALMVPRYILDRAQKMHDEETAV